MYQIKHEGGYEADRNVLPVGKRGKGVDMSKAVLYRYDDAEAIRNATADELAASLKAAESDGGAGVITVDGVDCYVQE